MPTCQPSHNSSGVLRITPEAQNVVQPSKRTACIPLFLEQRRRECDLLCSKIILSAHLDLCRQDGWKEGVPSSWADVVIRRTACAKRSRPQLVPIPMAIS